MQHGFSSGGQAVGHGADVAWNATGGKVVHFVYVHKSGFEVGAGLVLGVVAAATGIGAILEGATGTGLFLGGASVIAGSGATAFDLGPCVHNGNPTACAGLGLGATSILAGGTGTIGTGLVVGGYISEPSLAAGLLNGAGAFGWNVGIAGTIFDTTTGITRAGAGTLAPCNWRS